MSLLIYNLTDSPLTLANGVGTKIPPSTTSAGYGVRGKPWYASGNEMEGRSYDEYSALQVQQDRGYVKFVWPVYEEYPTPGLIVQIGAQAPPAPSTDYPVLSATALFDEPEYETGQERTITLLDSTPYKLRILQVLVTVSRGAPGAYMYLCCYPNDVGTPRSDKFDVSQPGNLIETSMVNLDARVIDAGKPLHAFCTTDYVLGCMTVSYQRVA
jgi:hypothetical protein